MSVHDTRSIVFFNSYTMERFDVQFISAPKDQLNEWWKSLDQEMKNFVKAKVGRLIHLLEIDTQTGVPWVISQVWCLETSTFVFGKHELTFTLEEYSVALGISRGTELVRLSIGIKLISILSQFLRIEIAEVKKVVKANCNACPFTFSTKCFF